MGNYPPSAEEIASLIQRYNHIVVTSHINPDGDAIGACGVISYILKALGKRFIIYNATGIPYHLEWVPLPAKVITRLMDIPFKPELFIILDCGDIWRLGRELSSCLLEYQSINIDHHIGNPNFGTLANWVEPKAAATGQLVAAIAEVIGIPLTGELAQCLYLSIVTDTGSFAYSNTSPGVLHLAAKLIELGLDPSPIREHLDNQWTLTKFHLWGNLMQKVQLEYNGQIAISAVTLKTITDFGATKEDLEGFTEQIRKIKGVRVAALVREDPGGSCKVSLRSSGTDNVQAVAIQFGGGGHFNAAGATIHEPIETAVKQILEAVQKITFSTTVDVG